MTSTSLPRFRLALVLALTWTAGAPSVEAEEAPAPAPDDLAFEVRFADERSSYAQGEVIRLELAFSSTTPERYQLDGATYDRSGRMSLESFELEPAGGAVDPLRDYFSSGLHFGGGLRSMPTLGAEPEKIELVLNEWLRFDRPGSYTLRVRTKRVAALETDGSRDRERPIELVSAPLALEIVPVDPLVAADAVAEAVSRLDAADATTRQRACDVLRHSGAAAAVDALAEALLRREDVDAPCGFDAMLGLYAHRDRALVLERLEARLFARESTVGTSLVGTLANLRWLTAHPRPSEDAGEALRAWYAAQRVEVARLGDLYLARLAAGVEGKTGPALATTLATLVESGTSLDGPGLPLGARLAPVFESLPPSRQLALLERRWEALRDPAFEPILERLIADPPEGSGFVPPVPDLLALRLFDLAPDKAQALVRRDVARPDPQLALATLEKIGLIGLPPALEASLVDRWTLADSSGRRHLGALVARFGSPALRPRVEKLFGEPWLAEAPRCWQSPFLAYFLRIDPALGRDRLRQAVAQATRDGDSCRGKILEEVGAFRWSSELEQEVVAALEGSDADLARVAAEVLREHGSATGEAALWRRLERWSERWRGRDSELAYRRGKDPNEVERRLGWELLRALLDGKAWALGRADVQRLADLCVGENDCGQVGHALSDFGDAGEVLLTVYSVDPPKLQVARATVESVEALEARLALYPAGSVFLCWQSGDDEAAAAKEELLRRVETFLADRGMGLVVRTNR